MPMRLEELKNLKRPTIFSRLENKNILEAIKEVIETLSTGILGKWHETPDRPPTRLPKDIKS